MYFINVYKCLYAFIKWLQKRENVYSAMKNWMGVPINSFAIAIADQPIIIRISTPMRHSSRRWIECFEKIVRFFDMFAPKEGQLLKKRCLPTADSISDTIPTLGYRPIPIIPISSATIMAISLSMGKRCLLFRGKAICNITSNRYKGINVRVKINHISFLMIYQNSKH